MKVPVDVYDLTAQPLAPGFYWSIPISPTGEVDRADPKLVGPFASREDALANASSFLTDAARAAAQEDANA